VTTLANLARRHLVSSVACTFALLASGCTDTYQLVRPAGWSTPRITTVDSVYVAVPEDGSYESRAYIGSGLTTSQIIGSAFARRARSVTVGRAPESREAAVEHAATNGVRYVVLPTILHWEDRATEWSGIPDEVAVRIDVLDVASRAILGTVTVEGTSGLATFGGDHPEELLPEPVEEFVTSLY
jgi:hypothetical protein